MADVTSARSSWSCRTRAKSGMQMRAVYELRKVVNSARNAPGLVAWTRCPASNGDAGAVNHGPREFLHMFLGHEAARPAANHQGRHADRGDDLGQRESGSSTSGRICSTTAQSNDSGPAGRKGVWGGRGWGIPTSSSTSRRTRACSLAATWQATRPPSEWPTRSTSAAGSMGSEPVTSPAISEMAYLPGQLLSPWPRRSTAKTVPSAHSFAAITSQSPAVAPVPGREGDDRTARPPHGTATTAPPV
jgi:hypothetical protein